MGLPATLQLLQLHTALTPVLRLTSPRPPPPLSLPPPRPCQDLDYGSPGVLGQAATWPQAAAALPPPPGAQAFDWEGDRPLGLPIEDMVVYEMHVRGFTQGEGSGVTAPGERCAVLRCDAPAACGMPVGWKPGG